MFIIIYVLLYTLKKRGKEKETAEYLFMDKSYT